MLIGCQTVKVLGLVLVLVLVLVLGLGLGLWSLVLGCEGVRVRVRELGRSG